MLMAECGGGRKDDVVGCSANLSGTYWIVVIRPQLSRTATTRMCNAGDRSISVLNRPARTNTLVACP